MHVTVTLDYMMYVLEGELVLLQAAEDDEEDEDLIDRHATYNNTHASLSPSNRHIIIRESSHRSHKEAKDGEDLMTTSQTPTPHNNNINTSKLQLHSKRRRLVGLEQPPARRP